jgi:rhodanese-related sulfurtransferase
VRLFPLSLVLLIACASGVSPTPSTEVASAAAGAAASPVRDVEVAALKADLDRGAAPVLVDVRTPEEFGAGHVSEARNIPMDALEARIGELGAPGTEVYVICQSGGRSAAASRTLAARGYRAVNVLGGTAAWRAAGYPVAP